ncbi:N-acetylglucosamine kinase [Melioribacteraceae bacterium 4301-Me]|uniref:N-acetylglucosamine kinase n=1 Tax=Pyranulibacter aquaticus TaxID=3163344 RepID=UPI003596A6C1
MSSKYFIGLDGGGTKTKCVVTDYELNPLYSCEGGQSNFLIIGTQRVASTILSLILSALNYLKISSEDVESILIGTTGAGRKDDAEKLKNDFMTYAKVEGYSFKSFIVESDARIALEGAFSGKEGCLLIVGTGSIIIAKDNFNKIYRAGGYGRLIGDEGSGYTLGRKGLNLVAKEYDGRGGKTLLTEMLSRDFGITSASELITQVYRNNFDIASFAPKVIEAAQMGDALSKKVLDEESDELILHVKSMLKIMNKEEMKLCLTGSVISTENYYSNLFKDKLKKTLQKVEIVKAENQPAMGAAIMAKNLAQTN